MAMIVIDASALMELLLITPVGLRLRAPLQRGGDAACAPCRGGARAVENPAYIVGAERRVWRPAAGVAARPTWLSSLVDGLG